MAERNLQSVSEKSGVRKSLNFQSASTVRQKITVDGSDHAVTLTNPHVVCNSQNTGATIALKLLGESAFMTEYFAAGQERVMHVVAVGSTTEGSDSGTVVVIRGVD